eukprot:427445-Hanusia_phi.AAC.3
MLGSEEKICRGGSERVGCMRGNGRQNVRHILAALERGRRCLQRRRRQERFCLIDDDISDMFLEAIQEFKAAVPSKGILFNLGVSTAKLGDNQAAIRHFDEVIRLDPNLAVAYLTRGACKHHERLFGEAIADYDRAISLISNGSLSMDYSGDGLQFEMNRVIVSGRLAFQPSPCLEGNGAYSGGNRLKQPLVKQAGLSSAQAQEDVARAKKLIDQRTKSRQPAIEKLSSQLEKLALNPVVCEIQARSNTAPTHPSHLPQQNMSGSTSNGAAPSLQIPYSQPPTQAYSTPTPPEKQATFAPSPPVPAPAPVSAPAPAPAQAPAPAAPSLRCATAEPTPSTKSRSAAPPGIYTLEQLTGHPPFPEGVDPTKRETYLSEEQFQQVFNCSKAEFQAMPQWKRETPSSLAAPGDSSNFHCSRRLSNRLSPGRVGLKQAPITVQCCYLVCPGWLIGGWPGSRRQDSEGPLGAPTGGSDEPSESDGTHTTVPTPAAPTVRVRARGAA